jgi:hypothetical protein
MTRPLRERERWVVVVLFGTAMAWVEAACVYYLRLLVGRIEPYQQNPLPISGVLGPVELVREASTLVMLLTVGMLSGRTWQKRVGYTLIAFGVWDIFYYVFLRAFSGWPRSIFDWDILFLLPLPWWGPVLAPVSIALLMIIWGTFATQWTRYPTVTPLTWRLWGLSAIGIALALYVFMEDALFTAQQGIQATRDVLPTRFNWLIFSVALALMAAPAIEQVGWRLRLRRGERLAA